MHLTAFAVLFVSARGFVHSLSSSSSRRTSYDGWMGRQCGRMLIVKCKSSLFQPCIYQSLYLDFSGVNLYFPKRKCILKENRLFLQLPEKRFSKSVTNRDVLPEDHGLLWKESIFFILQWIMWAYKIQVVRNDNFLNITEWLQIFPHR